MSDPHFISFNSFDEMQDFLQRNESAANARINELQRGMMDREEHWYIRDAGGIVVVGHIPSLADTLKAEREIYPAKMDRDQRAEFAWSEASLYDRSARGYVFGRHFSVVEPQGELGDVHVSNCIPITREAFEELKALGWQFKNSADAPLTAECCMAFFKVQFHQ